MTEAYVVGNAQAYVRGVTEAYVPGVTEAYVPGAIETYAREATDGYVVASWPDDLRRRSGENTMDEDHRKNRRRDFRRLMLALMFNIAAVVAFIMVCGGD